MTHPLLDKLDPSAEAEMRSIIGGAVRTQAVYVAATLEIADKLALGPRSAAELAGDARVDAGMLWRVLRYLVSIGVFLESDDGRFALNRTSESLQRGHPRSLWPSAIRAGENLWNVSGRMLEAVRTGNTPHELLHGSGFFERMAERGKESAFASRMMFTATDLGPAIAADECFARARTVIDVGGGHGAQLAVILRTHPHLQGVLVDQAATLEGAERVLGDAGVRDRCELVPGDFFESLPAGDVYVLSWILHDWNDEKASRILRVCRSAARDAATWLIVEVLLPEHASEVRDRGAIADPFTLDMQMLLLTGGQERTLAQYETLLRAAGLTVTSVRTPPSIRGASILTAVPSWEHRTRRD